MWIKEITCKGMTSMKAILTHSIEGTFRILKTLNFSHLPVAYL